MTMRKMTLDVPAELYKRLETVALVESERQGRFVSIRSVFWDGAYPSIERAIAKLEKKQKGEPSRQD